MQSYQLNKLICHCCKMETSLDSLVLCKSSCCNLFFCHKCLTSRYKYSKVKVSKLPTPHWKCPVCANRCQCDQCIKAGITAPIKKKRMKRKEAARRLRRKRRVRKPTFQIQSNCETRTPLSEKESDQFLNLVAHCLIPPISSTYLYYCS